MRFAHYLLALMLAAALTACGIKGPLYLPPPGAAPPPAAALPVPPAPPDAKKTPPADAQQ